MEGKTAGRHPLVWAWRIGKTAVVFGGCVFLTSFGVLGMVLAPCIFLLCLSGMQAEWAYNDWLELPIDQTPRYAPGLAEDEYDHESDY